MKVSITTIPHSEQRYETVGDYVYGASLGDLQIAVSDTGNVDYNFLVAIHELCEAYLCQRGGIPQAVIDRFDMAYEACRKPDDVAEPGDHYCAPYRNEHCIATGVERTLAGILGVSWSDYERALENLSK